MPSTRDILAEQRRKILERLRAREPDTIRELEAIDLAIANLGSDSGPPMLYTRYPVAVDAVCAYLSKIMQTEEFDVIAETIVKGGWLAGNPNASKNARASIKYHLDHAEKQKIIKRFPSGRVGLYEWGRDFDDR